jgi:hypothetical protein
MPQAFASLGSQVGTGRKLVRAIVTLLLVEAEGVWELAATPVTTRTRTNARMMFFMKWLLGMAVFR